MFGFEFFDAFEFGHAHAAVFALPVVEGWLGNAVLAADVGDFRPASASLRIETIRIPVNLLFFMVRIGVARPDPLISICSGRGKPTVGLQQGRVRLLSDPQLERDAESQIHRGRGPGDPEADP